MARAVQLVIVLSVFLLSFLQTGTAQCDGEWRCIYIYGGAIVTSYNCIVQYNYYSCEDKCSSCRGPATNIE